MTALAVILAAWVGGAVALILLMLVEDMSSRADLHERELFVLVCLLWPVTLPIALFSSEPEQ